MKIKVGHQTYEVIFTQDNNKFNVKDNYGEHHSNSQQIFIGTDSHIEIQKEILLHELMHACFQNFWKGASIEMNKDSIEEFICTQLSKQLMQVMKDNPELVKHLMSKK